MPLAQFPVVPIPCPDAHPGTDPARPPRLREQTDQPCEPLASARSAIRKRVVGLDESGQTLRLHMGVDLRGGDVGVTEQGLQGAQVGAVRQHVAGEGVPQHLRLQPRRGNAGAPAGLSQDQVETLAAQWPARIATGEQPRRGRRGAVPQHGVGRLARFVR